MAKALEVDDLDRLVKGNTTATGIAVLIGNSYEHYSKGKKKLAGPPKDIDCARRVFSGFGAACLMVKNKIAAETKAIIAKVAGKAYPESYQYIVVVFSGHGDKGGVLRGNDWNQIYLKAHVVEPFQPKNAKQIAKLPKLFFIDACRGDNEFSDLQVPRGSDEDQLMPRGGDGIESIRFPPEGNIFLAFSTLPKRVSYELASQGGVWINKMLEGLVRENKDVSTIFHDVNKELLEHFQERKEHKMQQPELRTTLIGSFNFHEISAANQDASLRADQSCQELYTTRLNLLKTDKKITNRDYAEIIVPHGNQHTKLLITLPNGEKITFISSNYQTKYDCINSAQERVAKEAVMYISGYIPLGATATSKSSSTAAASKSPPKLVSITEKAASQELKNLLVDQLNLTLTDDNFEYKECNVKFMCTFKHKSPLFPFAIKGDWKNSKKEARRSAAYKALVHYQSQQ